MKSGSGSSPPRLAPGARGRFSIEVQDRHLASSMGNREVHVLATPAIAWLFESAATDALAPVMKPGEISVGTEICVRHLKPTPPGMTATATVTLKRVAGRRYLFDAVVTDESERVAEGHIERAIIDCDRFRKAVDAKRRPVPV